MICPRPEDQEAEQANRLHVVVTQAIISAFRTFAMQCNSAKLIRLVMLSNLPDDTAFWLISARQFVNSDIIANEVGGVVAMSTFTEWTPSDVLMCAIVQNQFNGVCANSLVLKTVS